MFYTGVIIFSILNEVLSLNAQESRLTMLADAMEVLNEVLSLNAQESTTFYLLSVVLFSSMKS